MRSRLLLAVAGAGALLAGTPVLAAPQEPAGDERPVSAASARALGLLQSAARAARTRSWSGTQHIVTVRDGRPSLTVLRVTHLPGTGSAVRVLAPAATRSSGDVVVPDAPDEQLLRLLAAHYDLAVTGTTACQGHQAYVVEATRPGVTGDGAVAGRYWVDRTSRLVLRRDVLDQRGAVVRSSSFVDLQLKAVSAAAVLSAPIRPTGHVLSADALQVLRDEGWRVQSALPGGMELFEARLHDSESGAGGEVLQLSYSDGLSTQSLFAQRGEPATEPVGTARPVGEGTVWVTQGSPERLVWAGAGRTWTLVTDAPSATVAQTVLALPHVPAARADDGVLDRVWRGMARVGRWVNPFH